MKFSTSALVLATLAIESASAATIRQHAHKHVHQKKETHQVEEAKRWVPPANYDWHTDPGTIYKPTAAAAVAETPAATPAATESTEEKKPATESKSTPVKVSSKKVSTDAKSLLADVKNYVNGAIQVAGKTVLAGANPTSSEDCDGFVWLGDDGDYVNTLQNESEDEINVVFFKNDGGRLQYVNEHPPALSIRIPAGSSVPVSMNIGASGAFAPIYPDTTWSDTTFLLKTAIGEFTAAEGADTTFDVSREWYMHGHDLTIGADDSCTSSSIDSQCSYYCKGDAESCGETQTYDLNQVGASCGRKMMDFGKGLNPEGGCHIEASQFKNVVTTFH